MCGIVGYTGLTQQAQTQLLQGLQALEYRGYDSAGIALWLDQDIHMFKSEGKLNNLRQMLSKYMTPQGNAGIGHTRWATHGAPTSDNAHPHLVNQVVLVHNGIIENYGELKNELSEYGYSFQSQTDTEVASALIDYHYAACQDKLSAIALACTQMRGSFAFALMFKDEPEVLYATRRNNPLILGIHPQGHMLASDLSAIVHETKEYVELDNEQIARLSGTSLRIVDAQLNEVEVLSKITTLNQEELSKGMFDHYMLKEIHEQPLVARKLYDFYQTHPHFDFSKYREIIIIGCGSALYAGMVAKHMLEQSLRIPVRIEVASEFRYSNPILHADTLAMFISQSGETADSVASLQLAREHMDTLAVVNVENSQMARLAKYVMYTYAGIEVSVATTKAYFAQVFSLLLNASLPMDPIADFMDGLKHEIEHFHAPDLVQAIAQQDQLFFLGRGVDYALCLEGALKLKEISYINAQAYQAGEMKHGTISLIQPGTIVIGVVTDPAIAEKTISNLVETQARGGRVILVHSENIEVNTHYFPERIQVKQTCPALQPLQTIVALQLLAYEVAKARDCEIDQPRNLAKSVSVE
ncbi:MAG: glutamine--fructose-6-phosphate transaminase (isomerizing) [Erysipelotrichaceae bacterium]